MRRPAQHHLGPTASTAWAHPYAGALAHAVFYNDGGQGGPPAAVPAVPPVPSPADIATRAGQQPAVAAPSTPPGQRVTDDDREVLTDKHTGQPMTQGRFSQIMTKQYEKSRNAAFRELAEAAGLPYDPDNFDPTTFGKLLKDAEATRQRQLSDEQRRAEDLDRREKELQAKLDAADQREAEAAKRDRDSRIRSALVRLGATGDDLEDATALLRVADDATDDDITKSAEDLKARRGEMFGATPAPQTLPPAPSGAPAGGNAPRQPVAGKDAVREAARKRARDMGLRTDDAA
jgi:hypothetical protein